MSFQRNKKQVQNFLIKVMIKWEYKQKYKNSLSKKVTLKNPSPLRLKQKVKDRTRWWQKVNSLWAVLNMCRNKKRRRKKIKNSWEEEHITSQLLITSI